MDYIVVIMEVTEIFLKTFVIFRLPGLFWRCLVGSCFVGSEVECRFLEFLFVGQN